jgi:hypothetical protein
VLPGYSVRPGGDIGSFTIRGNYFRCNPENGIVEGRKFLASNTVYEMDAAVESLLAPVLEF